MKKTLIKTDGSCYGTYSAPQGIEYIECADKPSDNHVLADNWKSDPMNSVVCWRLKTPTEIDTENDTVASSIVQDLQNSPALKVLINALMNGDFVPGTQYTPAQLKAIAKANK